MRLVLGIVALSLAAATTADADANVGFCRRKAAGILEPSPFFGFGYTLGIVMAKRLCGFNVDADVLAVRQFYRETHGCSPDSEIGKEIEYDLTYSDLTGISLEFFGRPTISSLPKTDWVRFCNAAKALPLKDLLEEPQRNAEQIQRAGAIFWETLEEMQISFDN
jgi:hypothetical protein